MQSSQMCRPHSAHWCDALTVVSSMWSMLSHSMIRLPFCQLLSPLVFMIRDAHFASSL